MPHTNFSSLKELLDYVEQESRRRIAVRKKETEQQNNLEVVKDVYGKGSA